MSQIPPAPNGDPPPPIPYAEPFPSPAPGHLGVEQPFAPPRTSGAAVASLVLGILGCVPFVTGLLAVIFGIVGFRSTGRPDVRGRGLALAGLILGILSLLAWGGLGAAGGYVWFSTAPDRATARQFVQALAANDAAKAMSLCQPGVTPATLQPSIDYVLKAGPLRDVSANNVNLTSNGGAATATVTVLARFPATTMTATLTLTPGPGGTRRIQAWHIQ